MEPHDDLQDVMYLLGDQLIANIVFRLGLCAQTRQDAVILCRGRPMRREQRCIEGSQRLLRVSVLYSAM